MKTDGTNAPIANVQVVVKQGGAAACCTVVASGTTDANGYFAIGVAAGGSYKLFFEPPLGFLQEFWHDQTGFDGATNITLSGSPVNIDTALLAPGKNLSGTVAGPSGPLAGVAMVAVQATGPCGGAAVAGSSTDGTGHYAFTVPSGSYKILFFGSAPYLTQWSGGASTYGAAATIDATVDRDLGRMTLTTGVSISGTIRDASGPLAGAFAAAYSGSDSCGAVVGSAASDASGQYALQVPSGTYALQFGGTFHLSSWWNGHGTFAAATPVAANANVTGIDPTLDGIGQVWSWGHDPSGQLGDNGNADRNTPYHVALPGFQAIAAGGSWSVGLRTDGSVWTWGANDQGQLGLGSTLPAVQRTPQQVPTLSSITQVATTNGGGDHVLALRGDGTVWAWGANGDGQLGDGSTTGRTAPVQVTGLTGTITKVAAGTDHSLALRSDGTVLAWGANPNGQLGDGTQRGHVLPAPVSGLTHVVDIAASYEYSLALKDDGTVWVWGADPQNSIKLTPQQKGMTCGASLCRVNRIAAGVATAYALASDGTIHAWGGNSLGQIGDGTTTFHPSPVQVIGITNAVDIAASGGGALALLGDLSVRAWGRDLYGDLGDGTNTDSSTPVVVAGLTDVFAISGGATHALALRTPTVRDVSGTVGVGATPDGIGFDAGHARLYVANQADNTVSVVDLSTNSVVGTIAVGVQPGAIAVRAASDRAYVVNSSGNTVSVINTATNAVVATVPVGSDPTGIGVDQNTGLVFVANFAGNSVSVIDPTTNTVVATVAGVPSAGYLAVDSTHSLAYVPNYLADTVTVIDATPGHNVVVATIAVGSRPSNVAVNETLRRVYVTNQTGNTVTVIDGATNSALRAITVGAQPKGVIVDERDDLIYVGNYGSDTVSIINGSTNTVVQTIAVVGPLAFTVDPFGPTYVTNTTQRKISILQ